MEKPAEDGETPFLHHPEALDDNPKKNGLVCFIEQTRQCGADCMAFQTFPPAGDDYRGQQWASCMLLVNTHRSAKHLTILAQTTRGLLEKTHVEAADRARASQAPPPVPR